MFLLKIPIIAFALGPPASSECEGPLTREVVVACALVASPRVRADTERVAAARGDAQAARVLLPSNPTASVSFSRRTNPAGRSALNVTGTLTQRIEIGGERRKRMKAAGAAVSASESHVRVAEREVVAEALLAYYDVLAARREVEVIERVYKTSQRLRDVAGGRASAGLAAPLAADLAAAQTAALRERTALAHGRVRVAEAQLASRLGLDPTARLPEVRGELEPLPGPGPDLRGALSSSTARPELARATAERRTHEARLDLLKRSRAPIPSLSFFVQKDGFDERVIGGGLAIPIPLPAPLGRTNKGKIQAARARIREADERIAATKRRVGLDVALAYHEYEARKEASAAYTDEAREQAKLALDDLSAEIEHGRLPVRDALLTQQALLDVLLRSTASKHALCRASVALALAAGTRFGGSTR